LAAAKAGEVGARHPGATVVAADTSVWCEGRRLGRPRSRSHARSMLLDLSGREHQVWTGVAVSVQRQDRPVRLVSGAATARVIFRRLSQAEVDAYLDTGEPMDKAGAYALQGRGRELIARWSGDRDTVAGLSRRLLAHLLAELRLAPLRKR
jgi:septum formation protein